MGEEEREEKERKVVIIGFEIHPPLRPLFVSFSSAATHSALYYYYSLWYIKESRRSSCGLWGRPSIRTNNIEMILLLMLMVVVFFLLSNTRIRKHLIDMGSRFPTSSNSDGREWFSEVVTNERVSAFTYQLSVIFP